MDRLELIEKTKSGKIFSATFIKADGTKRNIVARLGVFSHLNPSSSGLSEKAIKADEINNHVRVFDMHKRAYRKINCNTLKKVKISGETYNFNV